MSSDATGRDVPVERSTDRDAPVVRAWILEIAVVVAVLAALTVYVAPTLDRPLLERHAFRQTQTAWTAREFHEEGFDLLHPKLPVLGGPFEAPFEFPLFQAAAAVPMELGLAEDTSLRLTSLVSFLATALLLWGLVRYVAGAVAGVTAVVAFAFTPFALVWSRTSMIEYLATAGAVGFAFAVVLWRDRRQPVFLALALLAGFVGMLVKPTTAVFWILPALAYRPREREGSARRRFDVWTAVVVVLPLLAGMWWTRHADAIKAASPLTEWLTGWNLRRWNFGWMQQRLDPGVWRVVWEWAGPNLLGLFAILLVPAAIAVWRSPQRRFWLAVVSAVVLPPLVFTNLYFHHDYYLAAVSPAIAAILGVGGGWVWSTVRPRWLVVVLPVIVLGLAWGTLELGRGYWMRIHGVDDDPQVLPFAAEIAGETQPLEPVLVVGLDWSPAVLYYAHRRGLMVVDRNRELSYDIAHRDGYRRLFMTDPDHDDLSFLGRWPWVGATSRHMYGIADAAAELPGPAVTATDPDRPLAARLAQAPRVSRAPTEIRCGVGTRLLAGDRGTWLLLGEAPAEARLSVGDLAPVPARRAVFVPPMLADDGSLVVGCIGASSLPLAAVVDAPGPG